jgi:hypothetical protein
MASAKVLRGRTTYWRRRRASIPSCRRALQEPLACSCKQDCHLPGRDRRMPLDASVDISRAAVALLSSMHGLVPLNTSKHRGADGWTLARRIESPCVMLCNAQHASTCRHQSWPGHGPVGNGAARLPEGPQICRRQSASFAGRCNRLMLRRCCSELLRQRLCNGKLRRGVHTQGPLMAGRVRPARGSASKRVMAASDAIVPAEARGSGFTEQPDCWPLVAREGVDEPSSGGGGPSLQRCAHPNLVPRRDVATSHSQSMLRGAGFSGSEAARRRWGYPRKWRRRANQRPHDDQQCSVFGFSRQLQRGFQSGRRQLPLCREPSPQPRSSKK